MLVNFLEGRDFEAVARISSFDQLTKAVLKWLFDRVFQNDLDQWCKMNRQLESQEVAVHSNKVRIIKETFLANGHVDKTDLPPLEVMFERAIAAEQLLQQLHHGTLMRTANSARYADRRDDPHVMAVLREPPPTLGVQFPLQQQPTPRNLDTRPNLEFRTTADGYSVFLTVDAAEVLEPCTWMPVNPLHESVSNPRALSHLASYTTLLSAHDPKALKKWQEPSHRSCMEFTTRVFTICQTRRKRDMFWVVRSRSTRTNSTWLPR